MKSYFSFPPVAIIATAFLIAHAGPARGITTTWTADFDDWSVPANWSAGEPTTGDDAIVPAGAALVTQAGEGCASLQVGLGGTPGAVQIITGALEILGPLQIGDTGSASIGTFSQSGGTVTARSSTSSFPTSGWPP
jgi:hypothetical protein